MSLHYADTSLPDLLGRSSLNYADQAPAMQTVPLLCSKWASTLQHSFFKILVLMCNKKFKQFFWHSVVRILLKIRNIFWLSWLEKHMNSKVVYKIYTKTFAERKIFGEINISWVNLVCFVVIFDLIDTFFFEKC